MTSAPATIDTLDLKWQVSDKFKPDKTEEWSFPANKDGWVLAHNMLRGEINAFIKAIESISAKFPNATPSWAVESIQKFWLHHESVVHDHHDNEDNLMTPFMKTRIVLPEKLEDDHVAVVALINEVSSVAKNLKDGESLDHLLSVATSYKEALFPHLEEEEEIALPLLRSYFTPEEVKPITMQIIKKIQKDESGSFIHFMGEEYFRSTFMKQEGIPFFVWYLKFKGDYESFSNNVHSHIEALNKGVPITVEKATMLC